MREFLEIVVINDRAGLERAFPVMKELRTHLDLDSFISIHDEAKRADGYQIVTLERMGEVLAVMGYRVLHDYVHGQHLYIDDLVTGKDHRSQGLGARLLQYAEKEAQRLGCTGLRLCTGIENEPGKKFYEREGWQLRAVAYKKRLPRSNA